MENIPSAEKDAENVKENLTKFGFTPDEIFEVAHPKKEHMIDMKSKIEKKIAYCEREDKKVFVFVYFAGHGYMNDKHKTCIMLNDANPESNFFILEQKVRSYALSPHLYILAVFDCCRTSPPK